MSHSHQKSLIDKLYIKIMGDPNRPLYQKIYSKVPPVAILSALTLGLMAGKANRSIGRHSPCSGSYCPAYIEHDSHAVESNSRMVNAAFLVLGVGVFSAYSLAIADRVAIALGDRLSPPADNQDNREENR